MVVAEASKIYIYQLVFSEWETAVLPWCHMFINSKAIKVRPLFLPVETVFTERDNHEGF